MEADWGTEAIEYAKKNKLFLRSRQEMICTEIRLRETLTEEQERMLNDFLMLSSVMHMYLSESIYEVGKIHGRHGE